MFLHETMFNQILDFFHLNLAAGHFRNQALDLFHFLICNLIMQMYFIVCFFHRHNDFGTIVVYDSSIPFDYFHSFVLHSFGFIFDKSILFLPHIEGSFFPHITLASYPYNDYEDSQIAALLPKFHFPAGF